MKAAAHAKFSEMLLRNGNGVVIRLIAEKSVGRVHSNITSSTVQSGGREIGVLKVNTNSRSRLGVLLSWTHWGLALSMMDHFVRNYFDRR